METWGQLVFAVCFLRLLLLLPPAAGDRTWELKQKGCRATLHVSGVRVKG